VRNQRNAIVWAVVWWFARRWLRRRTAALAGGAGGRGRIRGLLGALALVGALAGALVAWRRLGARQGDSGREPSETQVAASPAVGPTPA
jgi:hypothetical protein